MSIFAENSKMDTSSPKTVPELFLRMLILCCIMLKVGCKKDHIISERHCNLGVRHVFRNDFETAE